MSEQIEMTYAGTTGHSGSETSFRQATDMTRRGKSQRAVMRQLMHAGHYGMTVSELRKALPDLHHGQVSSALTNLHRAEKIARLSEVRNRAKVYVLSLHVDGRPVEKPRVKQTHTVCPHCGGDVPL